MKAWEAYLRVGVILLIAMSPCLLCSSGCYLFIIPDRSKEYAELSHSELRIELFICLRDDLDPKTFEMVVTDKGKVIYERGWIGRADEKTVFQIIDFGDGLLGLTSLDAPKCIYFCIDTKSDDHDTESLHKKLETRGYRAIDFNSRSSIETSKQEY